MIKVSLAVAAVAMAACSSPQEIGEAVGVDTEASAAENAPQPHVVAVENDQMSFSYSWPAEAAAIPVLNAVFEKRASADKEKFANVTSEAKADAEKYDFPYRAYQASKAWSVATDTPRFLSFAAEAYAYTGGAHGNTWFEATLWDRKAETELAPIDLFTSPEALEGAVREAYCTGLKAERTDRLGQHMLNGTDIFDSCPALKELVVVLESGNGTAFDAINLLAAPYVAGSYAEGPYEVKVPVTQVVIDAAKPEYSEAFALGI